MALVDGMGGVHNPRRDCAPPPRAALHACAFMTIRALDHVNVSTSDLDASRRFYVDVLGLRDGERPPFESRGAWLYCGDEPVVHLVAREDAGAQSAGAVDHFAFRAQDLAGVVARLNERGIAYSLRTVPGRGLRQVFIHDPDGVKIELSFAASERLPEGG